jgi:hypothetical protein
VTGTRVTSHLQLRPFARSGPFSSIRVALFNTYRFGLLSMPVSLRSGSAILAILFTAFALSACQTDEQGRAPEGSATTSEASPVTGEAYGDAVDAAEAVAVRAVVDSAQALNGKDVTVRGRIAQVCQKKGCWLAMDAGDARPVRVLVPRTEEGYGFTVSTDASGEAVVSGTLSVNALDDATRDHYESDGAARPDSVEVQIAARGIEVHSGP